MKDTTNLIQLLKQNAPKIYALVYGKKETASLAEEKKEDSFIEQLEEYNSSLSGEAGL